MSWSGSAPTSYLATSTFTAALNGPGTAFNFSGDTMKVALFTNTVTPSPDTASQAWNVAPWNANEVSGTGWASGGVALGSPSLVNTAGQGGMLSFTASNVSQAGTTLAAARGCIIYDVTRSNNVIVAVYFGADYSSTVGTFSITWGSANGVSSLVWWILM